ncbi:MAG: cell division protein FtsQ/DivIB, partial [Acidimicrobiia bacterium]
MPAVIEMDRRIAARRREVAEVQARSSLNRLIWVMVVALVAALTVWVFRSPLLAVTTIRINGVPQAEIEPTLTENGLVLGRPMVAVRPQAVVDALLADPAIEKASIEMRWPQTVAVNIEPRRAVAWANLGGQWGQVGIDGVVIATAAAPADGLPILEVPWQATGPTAEALGGLEFLASLDALVAQQVVVISRGPELWAMLPNLDIRLGRPVDMRAKAVALEAVLAHGVEPGSLINLLAPTRPAVLTEAAATEAATSTTTTTSP